MRRERHQNVVARGLAQLLLDLRGVPVLGDIVGLHALVHLAEVRVLAGLRARARDAALGVDDDVLMLGKPRVQQRRGRQYRAGGVAARVAHQARGLDGVAVTLGQAVHRHVQQVGPAVRGAVPLFVHLHIVVAEVARHVDDLHARLDQRGDDHVRRAVRQRGEHHVAVLGELFHVQRHELMADRALERGIDVRNVLPFIGLGRKIDQLDLRVAGQQPHQLQPNVSGRADERDLDHGFTTPPQNWMVLGSIHPFA